MPYIIDPEHKKFALDDLNLQIKRLKEASNLNIDLREFGFKKDKETAKRLRESIKKSIELSQELKKRIIIA